MTDALGAKETRDLLARHGLRPRTTLGQHFITDPNTIRRIVTDAGIEPGDLVVEVGAGLGTLTRALAATGNEVVTIERDRGLAPVLDETLAGLDNVEVRYEDAMKTDWSAVLDRRQARRAIMVANLPYQIATGLVLGILESEPRVHRLQVMVQKEAGERLVAGPGDEAYGAVSVKVRALADARIALKVSRQVFLPVPEVDNVVVRLDRRGEGPADRAALWRVIDGGFGQRRKTLRRALAGAGFTADRLAAALEATAIDGSRRAETLSLQDFQRLAEALRTGPDAGTSEPT